MAEGERYEKVLEEARSLKAGGRFPDAARLYARALEEGGGTPPVLVEYAETLRAVGYLDEAVTFAERAASTATDEGSRANALLLLADLNSDRGRFADARSLYSEAAAMDGPEISKAARAGMEALTRKMSEPRELKLSPSVASAVAGLPEGDISAGTLAAAMARIHPEYGGRRLSAVTFGARDQDPLKPVDEWLDDVRSLFDLGQVSELHGRLLLVGLALVDETVRLALEEDGVLDEIRGELREPLQDILSPRGKQVSEGPRPREQQESVPTHTDNPARVDELGRKAFARILARRIRDVRKEEAEGARREKDKKARRGGAFLVHLHAPWGAGKTSLLNFLADELHKEEPDRWVVVTFNAWRHQRIVPPWWWLMTTIYGGAVRELDSFKGPTRFRGVAMRLREWAWRLKGGWPGLVVLLLATALLVVVWRAGFLDLLDTEKLLSRDTAQAYLIAAAAILTPALTIWGLLRGVSRWVFATSARGARRFIDNTQDPMRLVDEHVRDLVSWTGRNVIVLIDDLDRCKGPYVVELLEGIQTLFRDVPVTFVVAADRDWLADSYGAEYKKFLSAADQPGRPLGHLFLEKTFQISVGLPAAGAQLDAYWNRLLRSADLPGEEELDSARKAAEADLVQRSSDEARRQIVAEPGTTPAEVQARREVVAVEMASARAAQEAAHTLEPFRGLLGRDANPRAMKRLINAFGIARGVETLHGYNLEGDLEHERQTALWAILNLRWPKLGDHLARYPANVAFIGSKAPPTVPRDLIPLFTDDDVIDVVNGRGVDARLDEATVNSVRLFAA